MREAVGNKPAGPGRRHDRAIIGVAAATLLLLAGLAYYGLLFIPHHTEGAPKPVTAATEVETQRKAIERLRLEAAKAEEEQAKRAAEAEAKRKNDEELQRLAEVEQERQAAVAETEAKRKAAAAEAEQQRVPAAKAEQAKAPSDAEATKTEQERKAALDRRPQNPSGSKHTPNEGGGKPGEGRASAGASKGGRPAWMDEKSGGGGALGGSAPRGAGEQQKQSPQFPWPPPAASAFYVLPDSWFADLQTLGEVIGAIIPALERNGYVERSFFGVEGNGVALVTQLERISSDGSSFADPQRWPGAGYSLSGFLKGLFFVEPGRYRIIVFILRNRPFSQSSQIVTKDEARAWLSGGADTLSPEAGQSSFGGWHCTVLIYEFASDGRAVRVVESSLTGKQHLTKAGLLSLLEKN